MNKIQQCIKQVLHFMIMSKSGEKTQGDENPSKRRTSEDTQKMIWGVWKYQGIKSRVIITKLLTQGSDNRTTETAMYQEFVTNPPRPLKKVHQSPPHRFQPSPSILYQRSHPPELLYITPAGVRSRHPPQQSKPAGLML